MATPATSLEQQRRKAMSVASRVSCALDAGALRSNGTVLTDETRTTLLARAVAREDVSLDLEVLAFEQKQGAANRNFVRFREGAVIALGNSGAGKPFLADHNKWSLDARLGTILQSRGLKLEDGAYEIRMTVRLTDPSAVEKALRGLMSTVSIGWHPTGPVECSVHGTEVWTECGCWPGTRLAEITDATGKKKYVRDRKGAAVVEFVYTSAELTECSAVNVPAVPGAHIEGVRAALAEAGLSDEDVNALFALDHNKSTPSQSSAEGVCMTLEETLAAYNTLGSDDRAAFSAKLQAALDAATAADPIVHTTKSGIAVRKSEGANALAIAKQNEALETRLAAQEAETARISELHAAQVLATRARSEVGHLAGTDAIKVALLRAVDGIADEPTRTAAIEILRGAEAAMSSLATLKGGNPGTDPKITGAAEKIETLAVKYATDHKVDLTTARALVYDTPEGSALYAEMRNRASA